MNTGLRSRARRFGAAAVASTFLLTACGGGGGDAAPAPVPPPPGPPSTPPSITTQPAAFSAAAGTAATASVVAVSATTYQWQRSVDTGSTWTDIPSTNSATLTLPSVALIDSANQYRVIVSNSLGSVTSTVAALTVRPNLRLLAGALGGPGSVDAAGGAARFDFPRGMARDTAGNLYVADTLNHVVRRITPASVVTTYAGTPGVAGRVDGPATAARFDRPRAVSIDEGGILWVVDQGTCYLRRVSTTGEVTSFASLAVGGCSLMNGGSNAADPAEVLASPSGDIFVSDRSRNVIRRVDVAGNVSLFAGVEQTMGSADGPRLGGATFAWPRGLARDNLGGLLVADSYNGTIRRIANDGTVTTVAGIAGQYGNVDGVGSAARFARPNGIAIAQFDRLLVSDSSANTIRQVDLSTGSVITLAGSAFSSGSIDGTGAAARFNAPYGLAADLLGTAYVGDSSNNLIRVVTAAGVVTRLAGQVMPTGSVDGVGAAARFSDAMSIAADAVGNLFLVDGGNRTVRKITLAGAVTTIAGVAGETGTVDGNGATARFTAPGAITTIDSAGNFHLADGAAIRQMTNAGQVTTIAGAIDTTGDVNGPASMARFEWITHLAADATGNVAIAEFDKCKLRKLSAAGLVSTIAGDGITCIALDGDAGVARVSFPSALAFEPNGNLLFVDRDILVRRLKTDGSIETVAGSQPGNQDGRGEDARFAQIFALAVDATGRIYVADWGNHSIRLIKPDGTVSTLIPRGAMPNSVLGDPPSLRQPRGLALLPNNAIAIVSEAAVVLD